MNRKSVLTIVFFLSLLIIGVLAVQIRIHGESDLNFGANFFNGKVPSDSFKLISDFSTVELSEAKTILILFDPGCEACYNEIASFSNHRDILNRFNIILASGADSVDIALYVKNFKFDGFKSLKVGSINKGILNLYIITYPTVIVYDEYGNFLRGFRGGEEVEKIIK